MGRREKATSGAAAPDQFTGFSGPQDIALAIGIMSSAHMEVVWSMLEHLGRTRSLTSSFTSPDSQVERVNGDGRGRWPGERHLPSLSLLCSLGTKG